MFTRDREFATKFARAISDIPINWVVVDDQVLPAKLICNERFDLLVLDCASAAGSALLQQAREAQTNHKAVIIATGDSLEPCADEFIQRYEGPDVLAERIRELLPLMNEKRRGPRRPISCELSITHSQGSSSATALLLSQGGLMAQMEESISSYEILALRLALPGDTQAMNLHGKIVWSTRNGLVGLRFLGVSKEYKARLAEWLLKEPTSSRR